MRTKTISHFSVILKSGLPHTLHLERTRQLFGKWLYFDGRAAHELAGLLPSGDLIFPTLDGFLPSLGVAEGPCRLVRGVSSLRPCFCCVSIRREEMHGTRRTFIHRKPSLYSQPLLGREGGGLAGEKQYVKLHKAQAQQIHR